MKKALILIALVAGCGASDQGNGGGTRQSASMGASQSAPGQEEAVGTSLTGLYEAGGSNSPSQLCVLQKGSEAHFGLVAWGGNLSACSGAGVIRRDGDRLSLEMTGDQACTLGARIDGNRIVIDSEVPKGCSYYCGATAKFDGLALARKGGRPADAMKAKDPAGDPLCSS